MSVAINDLINREYQYLLRGKNIWDKKFFKDFLSSLFIKKTTIMGKLSNSTTKNKEKISERNRHFLEKDSFSDFPLRIEKRCFALVWEITDEDYICMDEVDIAKPEARAMEWLSKVRDWSTGNIVSWYLFHWVSIKWIPVILEREDLWKDTKWLIFKRIVDRIVTHSKWKWTMLLDAGYDIESYLTYLESKKLKFIVRAKRNRVLFDVETKTYKKMKDFPVWTHKVRFPDIEEGLLLNVTKNEKFSELMRTMTNIPEIESNIIYFKRWEIEQIFKTMKQEFQMEKIRVQSLKILDNTIAIIQLVVWLSNALFNAQNKFRWTRQFRATEEFKKKFDKFARRNGLTMNRNSIVTFISETLERIFKYPPSYYKQKTINRNPSDSAQQRLFTINVLWKTGWV